MRYFFYYTKEGSKRRMIGSRSIDGESYAEILADLYVHSEIMKLEKEGIIVEEVSFKKYQQRHKIADNSWK